MPNLNISGQNDQFFLLWIIPGGANKISPIPHKKYFKETTSLDHLMFESVMKMSCLVSYYIHCSHVLHKLLKSFLLSHYSLSYISRHTGAII